MEFKIIKSAGMSRIWGTAPRRSKLGREVLKRFLYCVCEKHSWSLEVLSYTVIVNNREIVLETRMFLLDLAKLTQDPKPEPNDSNPYPTWHSK